MVYHGGMAVFLGAPFWFDVLNRFMSVRNAIRPSEGERRRGVEGTTAPAVTLNIVPPQSGQAPEGIRAEQGAVPALNIAVPQAGL